MDKVKSLTGKYIFIRNERNELVFDRNNKNNIEYLANCAALSFHKALIGIAELRAIKLVSSSDKAGGFRISKSINTYYVAYHTVVSLMLLDSNYELKYNSSLRNGQVPLEVSLKQLNKEYITPEQWEEGKNLEEDLGSRLKHKDIKKYFKQMRSRFQESYIFEKPQAILYKYFIHHDNSKQMSSNTLYEKLCYIRDRSVYRPTWCINDVTGGFIQTSLNVRKEIDELPSYEELLNICTEIYMGILDVVFREDVEEQVKYKYRWFLSALWHNPIYEDRDHLIKLGWNEDDIEQMIFKNTDGLALCSYKIQLSELVNIERFKEDIKSIWTPLENMWYEEIRMANNKRLKL